MCVKVYIAGPYSGVDILGNVYKAIEVGESLIKHGLVPFVPHLTHFWGLVSQHDYEFWLSYDLRWLAVCDCLLRLPGESPGADKEERFAEEHGIPVYRSIGTLVANYEGGCK